MQYMLEKASALNKPLAICIGIGTNFGGHDGFGVLEEYITAISGITGVAICAAAGNESNSGHHTNGTLKRTEDMQTIEVRVPENADSFVIHIWNNAEDRISVGLKSPSGEEVSRVPAKSGIVMEANLILEKTTVVIEYFFPVQGSGAELTKIRLINPTSGIWTINVYGDIILNGEYNAWLPITGFVSPRSNIFNTNT